MLLGRSRYKLIVSVDLRRHLPMLTSREPRDELLTRVAHLERLQRIQTTIGTILAESSPETTRRLIRALCELVGWDWGEIWRIDPNGHALVPHDYWHRTPLPDFETSSRQVSFPSGVGLPGRIWSNCEPVWIPDVQRDGNFLRAESAAKDGVRTGVGVPLQVDRRVIGVMVFFSRILRSPEENLIDLLANAAIPIGVFLDRQRAELLAVEQRFATQLDEERGRFASELHKATSPTLFSLAVTAELLPYLWQHDMNKMWYSLDEMRRLSRMALDQNLGLIGKLSNVGELTEMLESLIAKFKAHSRLEITLTTKGSCPLTLEARIGLTCIVQEALQNIIDHARATKATITVFAYSEGTEIRITDNGRGFDPTLVVPGRLGLRIMRESAEKFGADFDLTSRINSGTTVTIRWRNRV
jgi:signal transduction histidine kinase